MKAKILTFVVALFAAFTLSAQNSLNNNADNIVGNYNGEHKGEHFRVRIYKMTDGTYRGQMVWMEHDKDAAGNKLLDKKNPDKNLRNTPLDKVVLITELKYNAKKKRWDDGKIYDPDRGIRANVVLSFEDDGRLRVKGSLLGISESVFWKKTTK